MGLVVAFTQHRTISFARMLRTCSFSLSIFLLSGALAQAQFIDNFDSPSVQLDSEGIKGWLFRPGDGTAAMDFRQGGEDYASISVDATTDKRGIWWALIERKVSDHMDLSLMQKPGHEFRIEARLRVSHAPRRVNLQVATQRSTDYDADLMEYDIPDTTNWHVISMTTHGFDARPGDTVFGHMALMDWGLEKYRVDVDYIKVDMVDPVTAGPDKGDPIPYHTRAQDVRREKPELRGTRGRREKFWHGRMRAPLE